MLSKKESKLCKVERVQEQNIVKVDEDLVMEVTDNLLENAVRYAQKSIALQIKKKDGFLIISVEDDGIGFVDTEEKVTAVSYTHLDVYKRQDYADTPQCLIDFLKQYQVA